MKKLLSLFLVLVTLLGILLTVCGKGRRREDTKKGHENQEQGQQFFHIAS